MPTRSFAKSHLRANVCQARRTEGPYLLQFALTDHLVPIQNIAMKSPNSTSNGEVPGPSKTTVDAAAARERPQSLNSHTQLPIDGKDTSEPTSTSMGIVNARDTDSGSEDDEFFDARECNYEQHSNQHCGGCRCLDNSTVKKEHNFWQRLIALPASIVKSILIFLKGIFRTSKDADAIGDATISPGQLREARADHEPAPPVQPVDGSASTHSSSRPGIEKPGETSQDGKFMRNGGVGQEMSAKELKKEKERRKRMKKKEKKTAKKTQEVEMKDGMAYDGNGGW